MSRQSQDLYREIILEHAREPRNFGRLEDATHVADGINPLCGDKLHIYLRVVDGQIQRLRFEGSGCAISMASASLMSEALSGKRVAAAELSAAEVIERLSGESQTGEPAVADELRALDGVRRYPSRIKCATLAWHAFSAALAGQSHPASSEQEMTG